MKNLSRRSFLERSTLAGMGLAAAACSQPEAEKPETVIQEPIFKISLAQWSFHRAIFGGDPGETIGWDEFERRLRGEDYPSLLAGSFDPITFPTVAKEQFGIEAVEYVNAFFKDKATDNDYLSELNQRASDAGVTNVLIMCDGEGELGDPDEAARIQAVENHYQWVQAAKFLGCHSIRVNAASDATLTPDEQQKLAADGLRRLCEFADTHEINVLVENHGGLSSDAVWLAGVMTLVDHPRVGTLPDFANFQISAERSYDRYQGVSELMPFAKAVSAKSHEFDVSGDETGTDYRRMMRIVLDAGYRGHVGIEYEGPNLSEPDGIRATKALLEKVREELTPEYQKA